MPAVVQIEDLHKIYDSGEVAVHAVRGVSLAVNRGEFVALMGASGSGKSTLMNLLGCLDRPTRGRYLLDEVDVARLDRNELADIRNAKIGFVFQGFNLLARTTALENAELPMLYGRRRSGREMRERALRSLEIVGLAERGDLRFDLRLGAVADADHRDDGADADDDAERGEDRPHGVAAEGAQRNANDVGEAHGVSSWRR